MVVLVQAELGGEKVVLGQALPIRLRPDGRREVLKEVLLIFN